MGVRRTFYIPLSFVGDSTDDASAIVYYVLHLHVTSLPCSNRARPTYFLCSDVASYDERENHHFAANARISWLGDSPEWPITKSISFV